MQEMDIPRLIEALKWPAIVLILICAFGRSINRFLERISEIEIKWIKLKMVANDPEVKRALLAKETAPELILDDVKRALLVKETAPELILDDVSKKDK